MEWGKANKKKVIFEGKEKLVFRKEDKEQLLGHLRPLSDIYYNKFGRNNDRFQEQMKFWDDFFEDEFEKKTLIYGNDKNEIEKRVNVSQMVMNRLEHLRTRNGLEAVENFKGRSSYQQEMMEAPNSVINI